MDNVNPRTEIVTITNKLLSIYYIINLISNKEDKFFGILNKIGCLINVFFHKRTFSKTDCCTTSNSVWQLFNPKKEKDFNVDDPNDINNLFNTNYNIFNFNLKGCCHNFVILKYENNWYLIQSLTGICEMYVIKNNRLPYYLTKLLETKSVSLYNGLFKTKLNHSNINLIRYEITAGYFEDLPLLKLENLILLTSKSRININYFS